MDAQYPYPFFSQIHPDGSGWNDCFGGSFGAYGLAARLFAAGASAETILNTISLATRGIPDAPDNPDTTLAQASACLQRYGLPAQVTTDWQTTLNAPWAILLVDGIEITRADGTKPYPASWFGGATGPDHFVLWGPSFAGNYDWVMNPLDPTGKWARYEVGILQGAFNCAFPLPAVPAAYIVSVKTAGTLKQQANKTSHGALGPDLQPVKLAVGQVVNLTGRMAGGYSELRLPDFPVHGWYPSTYLNL